MKPGAIQYNDVVRDLKLDGVLALYRANGWSSAEKPDQLHRGLLASHSLITAWDVTARGSARSTGVSRT